MAGRMEGADCAAGGVTAGDRDRNTRPQESGEQGWEQFGWVLQVRIHAAEQPAGGGAPALHHGAGEVARALTLDQAQPRSARLEAAHHRGGAVGAGVVHDGNFERHARQCCLDALDQGSKIGALVESRNHEREHGFGHVGIVGHLAGGARRFVLGSVQFACSGAEVGESGDAVPEDLNADAEDDEG